MTTETVRKDYLIGNLKAVMQSTRAVHLIRSLFHPWDYADKLANQSLHWEPTEDRRHAYQWFMPSGDPTRHRQGGMLGANQLGIEGWTLFPSFPNGDRLSTRGFRGNKANNTWLTWPLWAPPLPPDAIASLLSLPGLHPPEPESDRLRAHGVTAAFRLQRILVGKTPNFTTARAVG